MSSSFARFQFPPVDSLAGCSPLPDLSAVAVSLHRGLGGVCLVLSPFVVPALVVLLFLPVSPLYFLLDALFVHRFISFLAPVAIFALVPALSSSSFVRGPASFRWPQGVFWLSLFFLVYCRY